MSRDRSLVPAMTKASSITLFLRNSAALKRADNLDIIAGGQGRPRPFGAAHDSAVDGDSEKPSFRVNAARGEQLGDRRHRQLLLNPVDLEAGHPASRARTGAGAAATRSGENGRAVSGNRPVRTKVLTTAAVTGLNRMPLRWCPVATTSPSMPLGPSIGASSRDPGRNPTQVSAIGNSSIVGTARQ